MENNFNLLQRAAAEEAAWRQFVKENGYESFTTFWSDFTIADAYGVGGVIDTYNRAFEGWKDDCKYLTELIMVLNHKIWHHYGKNEELAKLYDTLWKRADAWAVENLKGDDLKYYLRVTD